MEKVKIEKNTKSNEKVTPVSSNNEGSVLNVFGESLKIMNSFLEENLETCLKSHKK